MKPILFNTEMVRAILDGRKTVTRRLIKPCYRDWDHETGFQIVTDAHTEEFIRVEIVDEWESCTRIQPPPCFPGDILYVRETFTMEEGRYYYRADFDSDYLGPCDTLSGGFPAECRHHPGCDGCRRESTRIRWYPSIHMRKEAARIFLRVKNVRIERLQEITPEDAVAEGAVKNPHYMRYGGEKCLAIHGRYIAAFMALWNSTVKKEDRPTYGWDANPWVFVIEFERISKDEAMQ